MNAGMEFAHKFARAYAAACKPLCRELKLPQTAFDILMFLANNPGYRTAGDIVEVRRIKANLVSVNVDKLVREGYLRRETVEGDRRKTLLVCTERAQPVIERGRAVQSAFFEQLFAHTDEEMRASFFRTLAVMDADLDAMLEKEPYKWNLPSHFSSPFSPAWAQVSAPALRA